MMGQEKEREPGKPQYEKEDLERVNNQQYNKQKEGDGERYLSKKSQKQEIK